jgi:hypothetical protein
MRRGRERGELRRREEWIWGISGWWCMYIHIDEIMCIIARVMCDNLEIFLKAWAPDRNQSSPLASGVPQY